MNTLEINGHIEKIIGETGRMISGSKSGYRSVHTKNLVLFNANIAVKDSNGSFTNVWYGDIDLTFDCNLLIEVSEKTKRKLYIVQEGGDFKDYVASYDASELQNLQVDISANYLGLFKKELNTLTLK